MLKDVTKFATKLGAIALAFGASGLIADRFMGPAPGLSDRIARNAVGVVLMLIAFAIIDRRHGAASRRR